MKLAILMTSLLSSAAMAAPQTARAPQAPQAAQASSAATFQTRSSQPISNFVLIPAISIGSSSFDRYETSNVNSNGMSIDPGKATSYEVGVLAEMGHGTLVFQTGLQYINMNMNVSATARNFNGTSSRGTMDGAINYLAVPIAMKARVRVSEGIRLAGRLGVMPALLTSTTMKSQTSIIDNFGNTLFSQTRDADSNDVRKGQVFAMIGGGPEFRIARNQNIRVEANYERMLFNLSYSDATVMMQSINGMLSYGIAF